jgi:hypothetical protein
MLQSIPSQIWFFESLEANSAEPTPDAIHATSSLIAKSYVIQSCHENQKYLGVSSDEADVQMNDATAKTKVRL